jgi:hypothetical protein
LASLTGVVTENPEEPLAAAVTVITGTAGVGKPNPELWRNFCVTLRPDSGRSAPLWRGARAGSAGYLPVT